ncbi:MAG: sphingomyelin phosphodiesterase 2, partial [Myxococcota bacterium]
MSIRVATLNVWSLPAGLAKHKPQRMRAIYERVAELNLDVVAFQEIWTQESLDALVAGAKRAGFEHTWHNPEPASGSGLLVVSKLPIVKTHFEAFKAKGHPERLNHFDYYSGKGIALVTVEAPFGAVTLLNTHLHANYASTQSLDEYKGIRAVQVLQLVASVAKLRTPLIALGDFNLEETETSYRVLLGLSGLRDTAVDLGVVQP